MTAMEDHGETTVDNMYVDANLTNESRYSSYMSPLLVLNNLGCFDYCEICCLVVVPIYIACGSLLLLLLLIYRVLMKLIVSFDQIVFYCVSYFLMRKGFLSSGGRCCHDFMNCCAAVN